MILYVTRTAIDYGNDVLYDGLCRILGPENVLEYPTKPSLHGAVNGRYSQYPCLFDYPTKTDEEKEQMLVDGKFDVILVACTAVRDFTREQDGDKYDKFKRLLTEYSRGTPTYLVDMGDLKGINENLRNSLEAKRYFKREYTGGDFDVVPLSFSYSEKYIPKSLKSNPETPLFWAGAFQHYRRRFLEVCVKCAGIDMVKSGLTQEEYKKELLNSKIGLSLRGYGFDTVRYYEVPAHGAVLLSQKPKIKILNEFKDGETAVLFSEPEELETKLKLLLNEPEYVSSIRLAGHAWLLKHHTSEVRAQQLLDDL